MNALMTPERMDELVAGTHARCRDLFKSDAHDGCAECHTILSLVEAVKDREAEIVRLKALLG